MPLEQGIFRLVSLVELTRHHPALAPEVDLLTTFINAWLDIESSPVLERLSRL